MLKRLSLLFGAIAAALCLQASGAAAQATRTWVSGVGDDANPCSRTAPCKTFAGAISKTATGGEINTLDSGGFGAVTITKSISIINNVGTGGVLNASTNGVIVNAPTGSKVLLEGLDIDGSGTGGLAGVRVIASNIVTVRKCGIRNQTTGVDVAGPVGTRVTIEETRISGSATGVRILGASGAANSVTIVDSTIERNGTGVEVNGTSVVLLRRSNIFGSTVADLSRVGGGKVNSTGDNMIVSGDVPNAVVPLK